MTGDWQLSIVFLLAALVLPVSALVGRKLDWRKGVLMALTWASIFMAAAAIISLVRG